MTVSRAVRQHHDKYHDEPPSDGDYWCVGHLRVGSKNDCHQWDGMCQSDCPRCPVRCPLCPREGEGDA